MRSNDRQVRTIHVGLGSIGRAVVEQASARGLRPVAGIDTAAELQGQDLGTIAGGRPLGVQITPDLINAWPADAAIVCTGSRLASVAPTILDLVQGKLHVVSTCEELAYPWRLNREAAEEIDAVARQCGVVVVGTGVNPGFILDTLVLDLARASASVEHVLARRRVDVATRRPQLAQKVGVGLTPEEFAANASVLGHVGLLESMHLVADGLGFPETEVRFEMEPVVAERDVSRGSTTVPRDHCLGNRQTATASIDGQELVRLELEMVFGLDSPADEINIKGRPPVDVTLASGVAGDEATAALVVAAARVVRSVEPGIRSMPELPVTIFR